MLGACEGDLDVPDGGSRPPDQGTITDYYVYPDVAQGTQDGPASPTEGGTPAETAPPQDGSGGTGDQSPVPDAPAGVGSPCPCKAPLLCVDKVCRQPCAVPSDPCKAISNCPPTHGCVEMTNKPNTAACLPGLTAGQACTGGSTPCVVQHVCASSGGSAMTCLPICTMLGAPCGTQGGTCTEHNGCKFCSKP
jgi:hypothetical protein